MASVNSIDGQPARAPFLRYIKLSCLHLSKWIGLFAVARMRTRRAIRILCYHGIWIGDETSSGDAMFIEKETFERRLNLLMRHGYPVIPLSLAVHAICNGAIIPDSSVVITIDDGWYSALLYMFPALIQRGMPATLYCDTANLREGAPVIHVMAKYMRKLAKTAISSAVFDQSYAVATDRSLPVEKRLDALHVLAKLGGVDVDFYSRSRSFDYMTPAELQNAVRAGVDVQLHTHRHTMHDLSPIKLRQEILDNRIELAAITDRVPADFRHFCYPSGVASESLGDELDSLSIESSTTTRPGLAWPGANRHLLPRILDGQHLSDIEFEAELSGFGEFTRRIKRLITGRTSQTWQPDEGGARQT